MKIAIIVASLSLGTATVCGAQTRSVRDSTTAYGARLTAKGQPANLNESRVNSRITSRLENRLSLRIERYRPDSVNNPTIGYQAAQTDNSRITQQSNMSPAAGGNDQ